MEEKVQDMKCRKCRFVLLSHPEVPVEDSHGHQYQLCSSIEGADDNATACNNCNSTVWYISAECMPDWMKNTVKQGEWINGKINCPKCNARIGSFNFVSGIRCSCGSQVVPPIHIVKSKVDFTDALHK